MTNLKKWDKSDLVTLNLQPQDYEYLRHNGIEVGIYGYINVDSKFEFMGGVILGYDSDIPIVCDQNGDGIYAVEPKARRFANSSIEYFVCTIKILKQYCEKIESISDEDKALEIVRSTIDEMKNIDKYAWDEDSNYWPIIGQQMMEGNL